MATRKIDVPEELLIVLARSRLGDRPAREQVRTVLAIHLFLEGLVSIGKAAELAGVPRIVFEQQLAELGLPTVRYEVTDYDQDLQGIAEAERHAGPP